MIPSTWVALAHQVVAGDDRAAEDAALTLANLILEDSERPADRLRRRLDDVDDAVELREFQGQGRR